MASGSADNALGNGFPYAKRIADGQCHIPYLQLARMPELGGEQFFSCRLDYGQIGVRVGAYHPGRHLCLSFGSYENVVCPFHHMMVGEDVAVAIHNHPGAETVFAVNARLAPGVAKIVLKNGVLE